MTFTLPFHLAPPAQRLASETAVALDTAHGLFRFLIYVILYPNIQILGRRNKKKRKK
jgi:hypothetical protein